MYIKDENFDRTRPMYESIIQIVTYVLNALIIILACMQVFDVWDKAIQVFEPLVGVNCILLSILQYRTNKKMFYVNLFLGIFMLVVAAFILLK
jgi:hypothetical protein